MERICGWVHSGSRQRTRDRGSSGQQPLGGGGWRGPGIHYQRVCLAGFLSITHRKLLNCRVILISTWENSRVRFTSPSPHSVFRVKDPVLIELQGFPLYLCCGEPCLICSRSVKDKRVCQVCVDGRGCRGHSVAVVMVEGGKVEVCRCCRADSHTSSCHLQQGEDVCT